MSTPARQPRTDVGHSGPKSVRHSGPISCPRRYAGLGAVTGCILSLFAAGAGRLAASGKAGPGRAEAAEGGGGVGALQGRPGQHVLRGPAGSVCETHRNDRASVSCMSKRVGQHAARHGRHSASCMSTRHAMAGHYD